MHKLLVIVGPTSSGKTKLAVDLARKFNGEIVSADSRQVYKGMDIGTGKDLKEYVARPCGAFSRLQGSSFVPPRRDCRRSQCRSNAPHGRASNKGRGEEESGVPYHLIDIVSPRTNFTLAQYQKKAYQAIDDILKRGKLPILAGGTGLYVNAVVDGYVLPKAQPNPKLRKKLATLSISALCAKLKKLDLKTYRVIDKSNRRRLERAIEICLATGVPFSQQQIKNPPSYDILMIGLSVPRLELYRRIDQRLKERLKQGMIKEVARLHKQGVSWKRLESFGLEYRYISRYLCTLQSKQPSRNFHDRENYETLTQELARAIKHFARRQMTWFKRDKRIYWVINKAQAVRLTREFMF